MPVRVEERFWSKVDKNGPIHPLLGTRCWLWTGAVWRGYGAFSWKGAQGAHRVAWTLTHGELGALHVLHICDVKLCCNPDHLLAGTHADNMKDRAMKGLAYNSPGGPRGTNGGRRAGAKVKGTKPTTVRLFPDLQDFVRVQSEGNPFGATGVINDALAVYKSYIEKKTARLQKLLGGTR